MIGRSPPAGAEHPKRRQRTAFWAIAWFPPELRSDGRRVAVEQKTGERVKRLLCLQVKILLLSQEPLTLARILASLR